MTRNIQKRFYRLGKILLRKMQEHRLSDLWLEIVSIFKRESLRGAHYKINCNNISEYMLCEPQLQKGFTTSQHNDLTLFNPHSWTKIPPRLISRHNTFSKFALFRNKGTFFVLSLGEQVEFEGKDCEQSAADMLADYNRDGWTIVSMNVTGLMHNRIRLEGIVQK